jgi:hypothetical protein
MPHGHSALAVRRDRRNISTLSVIGPGLRSLRSLGRDDNQNALRPQKPTPRRPAG